MAELLRPSICWISSIRYSCRRPNPNVSIYKPPVSTFTLAFDQLAPIQQFSYLQQQSPTSFHPAKHGNYKPRSLSALLYIAHQRISQQSHIIFRLVCAFAIFLKLKLRRIEVGKHTTVGQPCGFNKMHDCHLEEMMWQCSMVRC